MVTIQVKCGSCGQVIAVKIPSTQQPEKIVARPPSGGGDLMFVNDVTNNSNLVSDQERRASIEAWLRQPRVYGPNVGYSNLEADKLDIGRAECVRQKRLGLA